MNTFTERCLDMQGFAYLSREQKARLAPALRFTPAACTSLVMAGLVLRSPLLLAATAAFALVGSLLPRAHPLDLLYNRALRPILRGPALPPNPAPRRFAAGIKSVPLFIAAAALQAGYGPIAFAIGLFLATVGAVAAITCWDMGSWLYRIAVVRSVAAFRRAGKAESM
ncbi:MAG: DUF4395 family protein [Chloroflexi bacterium]|nr:DUF4395 family protein [Chloroflexota bacterium]